jgi:hypothetical protein
MDHFCSPTKRSLPRWTESKTPRPLTFDRHQSSAQFSTLLVTLVETLAEGFESDLGLHSPR